MDKYIVMSEDNEPIKIFDDMAQAKQWIEQLPKGEELGWEYPWELDDNIVETINNSWFKECVYITTADY